MLYFSNIAVSVDQFLNVLIGGSPDETISSRAAKRRESCFPCKVLCLVLDFFDHGHCDRFIENDEGEDDVF